MIQEQGVDPEREQYAKRLASFSAFGAWVGSSLEDTNCPSLVALYGWSSVEEAGVLLFKCEQCLRTVRREHVPDLLQAGHSDSCPFAAHRVSPWSVLLPSRDEALSAFVKRYQSLVRSLLLPPFISPVAATNSNFPDVKAFLFALLGWELSSFGNIATVFCSQCARHVALSLPQIRLAEDHRPWCAMVQSRAVLLKVIQQLPPQQQNKKLRSGGGEVEQDILTYLWLKQLLEHDATPLALADVYAQLTQARAVLSSVNEKKEESDSVI